MPHAITFLLAADRHRRRPPSHALGIAVMLVLGLGSGRHLSAADVPTPESHLGFRPGADEHLVAWDAVASYFQKVDDASDRVKVRVLGETTEGRPYVVAFVSSPSTISDLERYRTFQASLHDPR